MILCSKLVIQAKSKLHVILLKHLQPDCPYDLLETTLVALIAIITGSVPALQECMKLGVAGTVEDLMLQVDPNDGSIQDLLEELHDITCPQPQEAPQYIANYNQAAYDSENQRCSATSRCFEVGSANYFSLTILVRTHQEQGSHGYSFNSNIHEGYHTVGPRDVCVPFVVMILIFNGCFLSL